jgi:hypothetical protein
MNYLFQLRGLFNDTEPTVLHMDLSGDALGAINESDLGDGFFSSGTPRYHTGWYAPAGFGSQRRSTATVHLAGDAAETSRSLLCGASTARPCR